MQPSAFALHSPLTRRFRSTISRRAILRVIVALAVVPVSVAGCASLFGPDHPLAGQWSTGPVPSGGGIEMDLSTSGNLVSGDGQTRGVGPNGAITPFTVQGSRSSDTFVLTLSFSSGSVVTYSATFTDGNTVAGPWEVAGQPAGFVTLHRQQE